MANYTDSLLASGEHVVRRAHQHWFVFVANARYAVLALVIAVVASALGLATNLSGTLWTILSWAVLALFLFGIASFAWTVFKYRNEEYLITNRRLIHASGVVNKKATDSSLEKINDAILTESLFGRMFGFGDLEVLTASEEGIDMLSMLRDAKAFKKAMIEAKHELELELTRPTMPPLRSEPAPAAAPVAAPAAMAAPVAAPPPAPVQSAPVPAAPSPAPAASAPEPAPAMTTDQLAESLARLGELRDQGLITPEEFDAKKAELLDRL
jgi:membrane protein YdbS with pleckstrin-like domain